MLPGVIPSKMACEALGPVCGAPGPFSYMVPVPVLKKLEQPKPPLAEPRLVFDEAGDFAPSYTEYMTVYILAEVWLPGQDGLEVHVTKGAHKNQVVKGENTKK